MSSDPLPNLFFADKTYSFETIRMLSHVYLRSSDFGEVITTVKRIKEGDGISWMLEWTKTADHLQDVAELFLNSGHTLSARTTFTRASNYYRQADFFLHETAEQKVQAAAISNKAIACFHRGIKFFPGQLSYERVAYEETTLPTYFWRASPNVRNAPTLIVHSGFDGTAEEVLLWFGQDGIERGYNIIALEGPGQGSVIRNTGLGFRHDWENVVSPVIDHYIGRPEIDPGRIALLGHSIGGYLAPRAAAFEPRIVACIANDGVFNLNEALCRMMNWDARDDDEWNKVAFERIRTDLALRWWIVDGMWKFGAKTPRDILRTTVPYDLSGCVKNIHCHVLVMKAERDHMFPGQPEQLYKQLDCPKHFLEFTNEYGAGEHTHVGAVGISNALIYNWLDTVFARG
jgi:pimeloyl-ACP methyl ester carboxylesterase